MAEYCVMVKILFQPNGRTLTRLINILHTINGNVSIMKEKNSRWVSDSLIAVYSLDLHYLDTVCIITDSNKTDLQNIKRQIQMIG